MNRAESRRDHADTTKSNQQQPPSSSSSSATAGVVIVVPPPQSTATTWDCPSIERIAASDAGAGAAVLMNGDNAAAVLKEDPDPETASTPRRSPPKLQNQVFFCRSCSPPHDRTQLPACLQSALNSTSSKPAPASTLSEASGSGLADNEEESLRRPPSSTPSTPRLRCFQTPRSQLGLGCATGGGGPRPRPSTSDCFIRLDSSPMRTRVPSFAKRDDGSCAQSGPVTPPDSRLADSARDCFSRALEPGASKKSHAVITASQPSRHRSSSKQRLNSCLSVNPSSSVSIPPSASSSSLDSKSMLPSCFSFSTLYASPPKSLSSSCPTPVLPSPPLLTKTLNSSMSEPPLLHSLTHPNKQIPFASHKPFHNPYSCEIAQIHHSLDSNPPQLESSKEFGCTSGAHFSTSEEETKNSHVNRGGEELLYSTNISTIMSKSPLLSLTSMQLSPQSPPPTTYGDCEMIKEVLRNSKNEAKSKNAQPSKPSYFNFSAPRPLSNCSKCSTFHVDSLQGYSQTFEATPRENQTSPPFLCLPFGSCVQNNSHPNTNHSCTQTSIPNLFLKNTPNSLNM